MWTNMQPARGKIQGTKYLKDNLLQRLSSRVEYPKIVNKNWT